MAADFAASFERTCVSTLGRSADCRDRGAARNGRDEDAAALASRTSSVAHRLRSDRGGVHANSMLLVCTAAADGFRPVPASPLIVAVLAAGLWRCSGRGVPALLHVGIDRRITVTGRDGRSRTGVILDDSYVGAWLTTIVWRQDGMPWWRSARTVVVLPDTLPRGRIPAAARRASLRASRRGRREQAARRPVDRRARPARRFGRRSPAFGCAPSRYR